MRKIINFVGCSFHFTVGSDRITDEKTEQEGKKCPYSDPWPWLISYYGDRRKSGGGMSLIEMIALHFGSAPFTKNIMDPSMKYLNEQTTSKSEFKSKANIVNRSSLNLILS